MADKEFDDDSREIPNNNYLALLQKKDMELKECMDIILKQQRRINQQMAELDKKDKKLSALLNLKGDSFQAAQVAERAKILASVAKGISPTSIVSDIYMAYNEIFSNSVGLYNDIMRENVNRVEILNAFIDIMMARGKITILEMIMKDRYDGSDYIHQIRSVIDFVINKYRNMTGKGTALNFIIEMANMLKPFMFEFNVLYEKNVM